MYIMSIGARVFSLTHTHALTDARISPLMITQLAYDASVRFLLIDVFVQIHIQSVDRHNCSAQSHTMGSTVRSPHICLIKLF